MDKKLLLKLIRLNEEALLDFKGAFYDIQNKNDKIDFVKDVIAMANSSVERPGYIICGVRELPGGEKDIVGIHQNFRVDDTNWVNVLKNYASHPVSFKMHKVKLEEMNKYVGVIEILKEQERPIFCTQNYGEKLVSGAIYFRNGSNNEVTKDLITIEKMFFRRDLKNRFQSSVSVDPTYNKYSKFPPAPYYNFLERNEKFDIYRELVDHHKNYLLSLTGDGGVGKTSIAYKVAEEVKEKIVNGESEFDDVIWISAKDQRIYFDERMKLTREFNSLDDLYNKILLLFYDQTFINDIVLDEKMSYVNQALEGTKFFFVLDNLEVFTDKELGQIHSFIKNTPAGHKFLLTSRHDLRVQEFIPVTGLDDAKAVEYINDVAVNYQLAEVDKVEIITKHDEFLKLTNGNPLYIKFFMAQIKRGKSLNEILGRRNTEGEKPLKAYCFDTTLHGLSDTGDELRVMYSLSVSEKDYLNFNELRFLTLINTERLSDILESLTAISLISKAYSWGQEVYKVNELLSTYLKEERRIPANEYTRLLEKTRRLTGMKDRIPDHLQFNFGLEIITNPSAHLSYKMVIDVMEEPNVFNATSMLDEARLLYPGNYLVPVIKNWKKIDQDNLADYIVLSEINTDFMSIFNYIDVAEERGMMFAWKALLYLRLEKYEEIIEDLSYLDFKEYGKHANILGVLLATAYHAKAGKEYGSRNYKGHDLHRQRADELFDQYFACFLQEPYFFTIKKAVLQAYSRHVKIFRAESFGNDVRQYPYSFDVQLIRGTQILFRY